MPRVRFDKSFNGAKAFYGTSALDVILGENILSSFSKPNGVHADREGRIYVTDTGFGMVIVFDPNEKAPVILEAGGRAGFIKAVGGSTDPLGNIYVSDTASDKVLVF